MQWSDRVYRGRGAPAIDAECRTYSEDGVLRRVEVLDREGNVLAEVKADAFDRELMRRVEAGEIRAHVSRQELDGTRLLSLKDGTGRVLFAERTRVAERSWG